MPALENDDWPSSNNESDVGSVVHDRYSMHGAQILKLTLSLLDQPRVKGQNYSKTAAAGRRQIRGWKRDQNSRVNKVEAVHDDENGWIQLNNDEV